MSERFDGRVALVTGTGTDFGTATAEALAREGANVAVRYRCSAAGAEGIRALGCEAETFQADIASWEDVQRLGTLANTPLRRIPLPSDIVPPVLFLASDDSRHITGGFLLCDGGHSMVGA